MTHNVIQNREICKSMLLISGLIIGVTGIMGIHPAAGQAESCSPESGTDYCNGMALGKSNCTIDEIYRGNDDPSMTSDWKSGYRAGWGSAGCDIPFFARE